MKVVPFGGPLGDLFDPKSSVVLHPRCHGQASVPDEASDAVVQSAPLCLLRHVTGQVSSFLGAGKGPNLGAMIGELTPAVAAAASQELGVRVQIGSLDVSLSDEDRAFLQSLAANKQAAPPPAAAPTLASPGAAPPAAAPPAAAPRGGVPAPAAGIAPKKKGSGLYIAIAGGVVVLGVAVGLVWHFTHEHPSAPAAHEHAHGKH